MRAATALLLSISLSGCVAQAAVELVTLPVRVVGAGVDLATTSQAEADRKRGREIRKAEERARREARRTERERRRADRASQYEVEQPYQPR
jgi:hypothetical protein